MKLVIPRVSRREFLKTAAAGVAAGFIGKLGTISSYGVNESVVEQESSHKTTFTSTETEFESFSVYPSGSLYKVRDNRELNQVYSDTVAQNALEYAISNGHDVGIYPGSYSISRKLLLHDDLRLRGSGFSTKLLGSTELHNDPIIGDTSGVLNGLILSDIEFDGSDMNRIGYEASRKAVYIKGLDHSIIENLYIHDTPATGLGTDFMLQCTISKVITKKCGTFGEAAGSNGIGIGVSNFNNEPLNIVGCHSYKSANAGILIEAQTGPGRDTNIVGCTTRGCAVSGFSISGASRLTITGCTASDNGIGINVKTALVKSGIKPQRVAIGFNTITNNTGDGINFEVNSNPSWWNIAHNVITANHGYGIDIHGLVNEMMISKNTIVNNTLGQIRDNSSEGSVGLVIE